MSLWEMSFLGAGMIAVIILLRAFLIAQLPKKTFLILWGVVMLRLLIPISVSSVFSIYSLLPVMQKNNSFATSNVSVISQDFVVDTGIEGVSANVAGETWESFGAQISVKCLVWFVGFLLCAGYFLIAYKSLYQEFQMSFPVENLQVKQWIFQRNLHNKKRKIEIKQSDRITSALSYGILHPVILFPKNTDWEDFNKLSYVLEHEYIHIKRYDIISKLVMAAVVCIHWFNPMVWIMYIFFNRDLELACDEAVIRHFGNDFRSNYAKTLISMEEQKSGFMPFCNNFNKNAMEERIKAIMKTRKTTLAMFGLSVFLIVVVTGVFASSASPNGDEIENMEVTAVEEGNGSGETIEQYLKQFESYGITYQKTGNNLGNIYWNGELVGTFWDEKPDGSLFLTESELDSDVAVCTSYDEHGNLWGISLVVEEVPYKSTTEISEMLSYTDENGEINYSVDDGATFFTEEELEREYPQTEVEWWSYEEYQKWLENEKVNLQNMLGETAWTNGRGEFVWTQALIDETIAEYEAILQEIKNGVKISKSVNGNEEIQLSSYNEEIMQEASEVFCIKLDDGSIVNVGPCETKEELLENLKASCKEQVKLGKMTQEEAEKVVEKYRASLNKK